MPATKRTKHDVICEFRCAEILTAAQKVFGRKGFDGTTVDDIAEAAGLAKGTIYLYFESKRDIYLQALKRGFKALMEETACNMDAAPTAAGKIRAFITTRIRYADENRDFVSIYYAQFGSGYATIVDKEFRNLYLRQGRALEAVMRQAAEQGQIRPVRPKAAGFMVYEMTRGLVMQRLMGFSTETAGESTEMLFDLIWKGLAPS